MKIIIQKEKEKRKTGRKKSNKRAPKMMHLRLYK